MVRKIFTLTIILFLFISFIFIGCKTGKDLTITKKVIVETTNTATITDFVVFEDLTGDGKDDTAAIIIVDNIHYYLDVSKNKPPKLDHITEDFLGDNVEIKSLSIIEGEIILVMVLDDKDETVTYKLEDDQLLQVQWSLN